MKILLGPPKGIPLRKPHMAPGTSLIGVLLAKRVRNQGMQNLVLGLGLTFKNRKSMELPAL